MSDTRTFARFPAWQGALDPAFPDGGGAVPRRPTGEERAGSQSGYPDAPPASTVGSTGAHRLCSRAMRLSHQVQYAICGIFDLAYNADMKPVQLRVIGERQNIPARYLEQIFQRLRRAGLVQGKRGPGGGYTLSRGTTEITLRDVVEAVEGPIEIGQHRSPRRTRSTVAGGSAEPMGSDDSPAASTGGTPDFLWGELAERIAAELLARLETGR
jgi:Rrf2 family protein